MAGYDSNEGFTRFLDVAANHRLLTASEEVTLARRWHDHHDEAARHSLALHNIRLVVSIARNFINRGVDFPDLVQAGYVGLDRASRKFDPDKGFKFSTYASWWVRQSIQRVVASEGKTIRVPNQVSTRRLQIDSYMRDNPTATLEDVAARLGCTIPQVTRALSIAEVSTSLDQEYLSDTQFTLADTLADPVAIDPLESVTEGAYAVHEALQQLTQLEREVVELRYGLGTEREHTLQEVAVRLEVPLREVQQAQRTGFEKLRELLS